MLLSTIFTHLLSSSRGTWKFGGNLQVKKSLNTRARGGSRESRFLLAIFLILLLLREVRHNRGRAGWLGSRMVFLIWYTNVKYCTSYSIKIFQFSSLKESHFQSVIRDRRTESLSQQKTGNSHPSEITRVHCSSIWNRRGIKNISSSLQATSL